MGFVNRYRAWRAERRRRWEAICDRCGLCCYRKRYDRGRLTIDLSSPCPYLDEETHTCEVYENRFRVCMDCRKVTLYHALFSRLMPASCAYVKKYRKLKFLVPVPRVRDLRKSRR